jgi:hypothetical protein
VRFNGETFSAGPVGATYTFNSYRVNYRWPLSESRHWTWHWGVTGEIRDAEVALQQGSTHSSNTNTGFVPLLHLAGEGRYGAGSCRSTPTGWPVRRAGPSISARAWATRWARASICSAACA